MQNLVWVASYPKSGNTWVRLFLASLMRGEKEFDLNATPLGSSLQCSSRMLFDLGKGGQPEFENATDVLRDRERTQRAFSGFVAEKAPGRRFLVKTHSFARQVCGAWQIAPGVSAGSALILRNPFDVCSSLRSHFGLDMDQSIAFMNNTVMLPGKDVLLLPMFLSSWAGNVLSWAGRDDIPMTIVRYEDLLRRPITLFQRLASEMAGVTDERRILKALKDTRFETLKGQEQSKGFRERSKKAESFFGGGTIAGGFEQMTREQRVRLYEPNEKLCRALGYHYDDDRLTIGPIDRPALKALALNAPLDAAAGAKGPEAFAAAVNAIDLRKAAVQQVST